MDNRLYINNFFVVTVILNYVFIFIMLIIIIKYINFEYINLTSPYQDPSL